jgi:hypothetical protein
VTGGGLTVIVTNARIETGNPSRPWATALGIRDGLLAVVGSAAEILKMAGAGTRIIDAGHQLLTLPAGSIAGSRVTVTVATDGRVTIHSTGDGP